MSSCSWGNRETEEHYNNACINGSILHNTHHCTWNTQLSLYWLFALGMTGTLVLGKSSHFPVKKKKNTKSILYFVYTSVGLHGIFPSVDKMYSLLLERALERRTSTHILKVASEICKFCSFPNSKIVQCLNLPGHFLQCLFLFRLSLCLVFCRIFLVHCWYWLALSV